MVTNIEKRAANKLIDMLWANKGHWVEFMHKSGTKFYLKKRGSIWWFRRRHPVIVLPSQKNPDTSGDCAILTRHAQAKGHVAVSLHTACAREARTLAARLTDGALYLRRCPESGDGTSHTTLDRHSSM